MNGGGLILAILGLAGLGFAGLFLRRAFAAPEVPLPPELPPAPPAPPVGEAVLVAAAEPEYSAAVQAIEVR